MSYVISSPPPPRSQAGKATPAIAKAKAKAKAAATKPGQAKAEPVKARRRPPHLTPRATVYTEFTAIYTTIYTKFTMTYRRPPSARPAASASGRRGRGASARRRLVQKMQAGPCIPVGIQL
jgi:hypothetical protein